MVKLLLMIIGRVGGEYAPILSCPLSGNAFTSDKVKVQFFLVEKLLLTVRSRGRKHVLPILRASGLF